MYLFVNHGQSWPTCKCKTRKATKYNSDQGCSSDIPPDDRAVGECAGSELDGPSATKFPAGGSEGLEPLTPPPPTESLAASFANISFVDGAFRRGDSFLPVLGVFDGLPRGPGALTSRGAMSCAVVAKSVV